MRKRALWLVGGLIAGVSLVASGATAGTSPSAAKVKPRVGGSVIFGADQEPRHLNDFVEGGDHLWAAAAHYPTMSGVYTITPKFTYKADIASSATFKKLGKGMRVTYKIKPKARWNDGKPITANDFRFTWQTIMSPQLKDVILSTVGYEDMKSVSGGNGKTVVVNFKVIYAGWRDLFGEILPKHCFSGAEQFGNSWKTAIDCPKTGKPIASGPFQLTKWNKGSNMVFDRNTKWYKPRPLLNRVVFRFVEDTNTQIQQIRGGELHILNPQPQLTFAALRSVKSLRIQNSRGPSWEKLDFNLGFGNGPYNPLLKKKFVRVAIAHAINRDSIVRTLLRPLAPGLPVLNSGIIMSTHPAYKQWWKPYNFSQAKARQIMTKNGCRRGGDGIFTCAGQRASFRWTGTTGNQRRELTFEIVQNQLKAAGIEVKADFSPPAITFGRRLPQGDYEIADYAWSSASPDISGWDNIYGCRSEAKGQGLQNRQGYCNKKVTAWLKAGNKELNLKKQAVLINKALQQMSKDMAILPLYQLPSMLIHQRRVRGIIDNPLSVGPFWNIQSWWLATS
jgi:peptide/nickel transport system substrate-binding protein